MLNELKKEIENFIKNGGYYGYNEPLTAGLLLKLINKTLENNPSTISETLEEVDPLKEYEESEMRMSSISMELPEEDFNSEGSSEVIDNVIEDVEETSSEIVEPLENFTEENSKFEQNIGEQSVTEEEPITEEQPKKSRKKKE